MSTPGLSTDPTGARLGQALRPGLDAAVVPGLLLLLARELVDHDPALVGQRALLAVVDAITADERADYLERS